MPTLTLPPEETKRWTAWGDGEQDALIYKSFNIDFERSPGKIRLSREGIIHSSGVTNFGITTAIVRSNADLTDRWWFLSNSRLFNTTGTTPTGALTADGLASTPTTADGDMLNFFTANGEDRLIVPTATDIAILNRSGSANVWTASWWQTTLGGAALASVPHPLGTFGNLLLVGDRNSNLQGTVHSVDDADVDTANRMAFPVNYQTRWIRKTADRVFVGTSLNTSTSDQEAYIFEWDGTENNYINFHRTYGTAALACTIVGEVPFAINNKGEILAFSGGDFQVVKKFPIWNDSYNDAVVLDATTSQADLHYNGMISYEDGILMLVTGSETLDRFPGGAWYYNLKTEQLYPRYHFGQSTSNTDYGQQVLSRVGCLVKTDRDASWMIAGVRHFNTQSTTVDATHRIAAPDTTDNHHGNFITKRFRADDAMAKWNRIKLLFKEFEDSTHRIRVKYRVQEREVTPTAVDLYTGTWASTTTFTAVLVTGVAVGHEVEVLYGDGAGTTAHISALSATPDGSATITVTIDETMDAASGTMRCRIENWTSLGTISDADLDEQLYSIISQGKWIQFKFGLIGNDQSPEIEKAFIEYTNYPK